VALEEAGRAVPPANFGRNTHWVFSGTTGTFESGRRRFTGTITLDPAKSPKWIDVTSAGSRDLLSDPGRLARPVKEFAS
jgi:uncharacterized protein (TIGR03067 family)